MKAYLILFLASLLLSGNIIALHEVMATNEPTQQSSQKRKLFEKFDSDRGRILSQPNLDKEGNHLKPLLDAEIKYNIGDLSALELSVGVVFDMKKE